MRELFGFITGALFVIAISCNQIPPVGNPTLIDELGNKPVENIQYKPMRDKLRINAVGDTTVLYRLNGGEVRKISVKGQQFPDMDTNYWGVLQQADFPDGVAWAPLRQVGTAKINDNGTIRNATQNEIDAFVLAQATDENLMDAQAAKNILDLHPRLRKILIALVDVMISEINALRAQHGFQDRTLQQAKTAILNRVNEDD